MPGPETARQLFEQGNHLFGAGDRAAAADCYRRALQIDPALSAASYNLGCTLDALAGPAQALPHFQKAAAQRPEWWQARSNLGLALARVGRMEEAARELEAAVRLNPEDAGIRNNLGLALSALDRGEESHASFLEALRLNPTYPEAHNNLAILFERYGRSSEAIASCRQALALRPRYPEAHQNLANALKAQGRHEEALAHYREALRLRPDYAEAHSALLFTLCYQAAAAAEEIFAEHRSFGARLTAPVSPHANDRNSARPLRIGYLSPDFREHAVARFIEPVLRHHDKSRFEVVCYSNVQAPDTTTARLAELGGGLTNVAGLPDGEAAERIRRDRIDILVDLSGHSAGNRLPLFALKPAPIQATWLGYPETTGLDAMDYRITDAVSDPPGDTDRFHTESLVRLPEGFSCFEPPADAPPASELPARLTGRVTFGSFNNPAKITPETVHLWAGALNRVAGSRMLIKGYSLADQGSRDRLLELFAAQGIPAERLELRGNTPGYREHLQSYGAVDIALDTFPYHGTTTTCEALWMGVPVVTLAGRTHRSRVGASLLQRVGLGDLVAVAPRDFAERVAGLALDLERLAQLRGSLRERVAISPLTDGARFTRQLEAAYRAMWQNWCRGARPKPLQLQYQPEPAGASDKVTHLSLPLPEADPAAHAQRLLQAGRLDESLAGFLAALKLDPNCGTALAGIEAALNQQRALDLRLAVQRDAARLAVPCGRVQIPGIRDATLEQAALALLTQGFVTPAELLCRYLQDRGYRSPTLSRTLAEIALALGVPALAAGHFREAAALGDGRQATIQLLKAEASARVQPRRGEERFLLIKAWGYGFWSDVNHLLGQFLVAELTGRTPVVNWGGNSLFSDDPSGNAFENFYQPVSACGERELARRCRSFYPPKWNAGNLSLYGINQAAGPWSRTSSLFAFERTEDVVVSDFHYAVHDLVPWIPPGHHLHGFTTDQVYLYLFRRYLKVRPAIAARAEAFYRDHLSGGTVLALHVRGGDKAGEDPNLALLNSLYPAEIERFLWEYPEARLFLITDDANLLASYQRRYRDRLVHTGATRTTSEQGIHYQQQASRHRLGEEVLVDVLLAARCQAFVGNGLSNVSCAVAQMKAWPEGSCRLLGARLDRLRNFTFYRS